jgi:lipoic acid synthetase
VGSPRLGAYYTLNLSFLTTSIRLQTMASKLLDIPIVVESGAKYVNHHGIKAIKDGVASSINREQLPLKKPDWLKIKVEHSEKYDQVKDLVNQHDLSTVCQEAKCPNINECWSHGTATIMVMGSVCTRACKFCSVDTGNPKGWLDQQEPQKAASTVKTMGLKYVVITSVDRDDLEDGGAQHFANTVIEIKKENPSTAVEVLTPDFQGNTDAVDLLVKAGIDVFAQNVETVKRLTHKVRDPKAGYEQTLELLRYSKEKHPKVLTKTSLMLGLGETDEEIIDTLKDLRAHHVDIVTLGQYLRPTQNHLPVERYVSPELFNEFRDRGLEIGFLEIVAGPFVRSSYRAERVLEKNNVGLRS